MKLEEEIKQTKFVSEHQKAFLNIIVTSNWLYNKNVARLKKYGITPEQYNVLRILRGSFPKPLMLSDITTRMLDKSSNATRLVEKLRVKGLVLRTVCEKSRRQVDIIITEKGLSLLTTIDNEAASYDGLIGGITDEEAGEVSRILEKIRG